MRPPGLCSIRPNGGRGRSPPVPKPSPRGRGRAQDPTVTVSASFPSRTACDHAGKRRRRSAHTRKRIGTFRNRGLDAQVVGCACVGGKPRTSHEDPFGNIIRMTGTGTIAKDNPFRFSTKRTDDTTDLVLYEFRGYSPSLGRWISRDPLTDLATLRREEESNEEDANRLMEESLKPAMVMANNDPVNGFDRLGMDADITWNPSPRSCGSGERIAFYQVGYGGLGPYSAPFVDDGTVGFFATGTGSPEYPNFGRPENFEDTPGGLTGPVRFITCAVCTEPCCAHDLGRFQSSHRFLRVIACKSWRKGDTGPLDRFPDATVQQVAKWNSALTAKYPNWNRDCYTATHKPK